MHNGFFNSDLTLSVIVGFLAEERQISMISFRVGGLWALSPSLRLVTREIDAGPQGHPEIRRMSSLLGPPEVMIPYLRSVLVALL